MASNFPTSLDTLTNPTSSDSLASPSHSAQHANVNDAVEALQAKVGADSSAVTSSLDYKVAQLEAASTGKILQVVYGSATTTVTSSSQTFVDTGLSVTITPTSTASTILVLVDHNGNTKSNAHFNNQIKFILLRGSTEIAKMTHAMGYTGTAMTLYPGTSSISFVDSPATTSATTYKTQIENGHAGASVSVQVGNAVSTIVAMEVSA